MELEVGSMSSATPINFSPATELEEILQNVRLILSTSKYSVPLDRGFGLNATMLDAPMPMAEAKLSAEIVQAVQEFEPRVQIVSVKFAGDGMDGVLKPIVRLRLKG